MDSSTPNPTSEAEQVRRAAGGDQGALAELLHAHRSRLRRMISSRLDRRLRGRVDPSDLIQEVFIDAAAGLAQYAQRGELSFFVWLRWLASMKLNEAYRRHLSCKGRDAAREVSIDRGAGHASSAAVLAKRLVGRLTGASEAAIREERKALLRRALEAMDAIDREILTLRHFDELTNSEAAEVLGLNVSATSKRYLRALRKLKESLNSRPGGDGEFRP